MCIAGRAGNDSISAYRQSATQHVLFNTHAIQACVLLFLVQFSIFTSDYNKSRSGLGVKATLNYVTQTESVTRKSVQFMELRLTDDQRAYIDRVLLYSRRFDMCLTM